MTTESARNVPWSKAFWISKAGKESAVRGYINNNYHRPLQTPPPLGKYSIHSFIHYSNMWQDDSLLHYTPPPHHHLSPNSCLATAVQIFRRFSWMQMFLVQPHQILPSHATLTELKYKNISTINNLPPPPPLPSPPPHCDWSWSSHLVMVVSLKLCSVLWTPPSPSPPSPTLRSADELCLPQAKLKRCLGKTSFCSNHINYH